MGSGGSKKCRKRTEVEEYEEEGELMLASFRRRLPSLPGMRESFELVLLTASFLFPQVSQGGCHSHLRGDHVLPTG